MAKTSISDLRFAIYINNSQASKALVELDAVTGKLEESLRQLIAEGKNETAEYKAKKQALEQVILEKKKLDAQGKELSASMKTLIKDGKQETAEFKSLKLQADQVSAAKAKLTIQAKTLNSELEQLSKEGKKDTAEFKQLTAAIEANKLKQQSLRQEAGLQALSMRELISLQKSLKAQYASAIPGSANRTKLASELGVVQTRITELNGGAKKTGSSLSSLASGMNKYWMVITTGMAALTGVVLGFKKLVLDFNAFEQKVANLSAITGLAGDDLKYLSDEAKELSTSVTSSGVKITASADDIVDGFKLMGSARPELLKDKEALAQVTESALTLAAAGQLEMVPAVDAVAAAMNQFQLGAEESTRIINVLGAGAMAGSAEIPQLTESLSTCGTVAQNSNLSLEQTIGVMETLAERQLKGTEAGTQFKSSLISMKAAGVGYTSGVFNMRDALVEIKKRMDAASGAMERDKVLIDIFGKRNITVGTILTQNIERYDYFAKAVTGTNVAVEQAITCTSTNSAKLEQAKNKAHLMALELGEKLAPAMTFSTNAFMYFLKAITTSINFYKEHSRAINSALLGIAAFTIATKANAIMTGIFNGVLKVATTAIQIFNSAMKGNPWTLIASGIAAAVGYLLIFRNTTEEVLASTKAINDITDKYNTKLAEESAQVKVLYEALKKTNPKSQERKDLIDKINSTYGTTLQNLADEKKFTDQLDTAYGNVVNKLRQKILLESQSETLSPLIKEQNIIISQMQSIKDKYDAFIESEKKNKGFTGIEKLPKSLMEWAKEQSEFLGISGVTNNGVKQSTNEIGLLYKQYENLTSQINLALNETDKLLKVTNIVSIPPPDNGDGGDGSGNVDKLKDAYEQLNEQVSEYTKLSKVAFAEGDVETGKKYALMVADISAKIKKIDELFKEAGNPWADVEPLDSSVLINDDEIIDTAQTIFADLDKMDEAYFKKEAEREKKAAEDKIALEKEIQSKKYELASSGSAAIAEMVNLSISKSYNKELALIDTKYSTDVAALKSQLDKKKITQEQYDKKILALDAKKASQQLILKQKQAKDEKLVDLGKIAAETAIAIMKAYATLGPIGGSAMLPYLLAEGIIQGAVVAAQPIPQAAKGRYPVRGADDGKTYNASVVTNARTGVLNAPTILAGEKPELIVDNPTFRKMQMDYPGILNAIYALSGRMPQFASGNYPGASTSLSDRNNAPLSIQQNDPKMLKALNRLNDHLDKGIEGKWVYTKFEEIKQKVDDTRARFGG